MINFVLAIIGTAIVGSIGLFVTPYWGLVPTLGVFAATGIWAAIDVGRLNFSDYEVPFPSNGALAILLVLGMWIVGFPLFLYAWFAVVRKTAKVKNVPSAA